MRVMIEPGKGQTLEERQADFVIGRGRLPATRRLPTFSPQGGELDFSLTEEEMTGALTFLRREDHAPEAIEAFLRRTASPALDMIRHGLPQRGLPSHVNAWRADNVPNLWRGARRVLAAKALGLSHIYGQLWMTDLRQLHKDGRGWVVLTPQGDYRPTRPEEAARVWRIDDAFVLPEFLGLASLRVVTTTGVNFMVDAFQNSVELEILKYHGMGTGTGSEAAGDTALGTELTTEYNPDSTRATGSLGEGASANIYRTVGTNTIDSGTPAVTEHGVLSQAATGGGTLLDRSKFAADNLVSGDGIQFTYDFTVAAGS